MFLRSMYPAGSRTHISRNAAAKAIIEYNLTRIAGCATGVFICWIMEEAMISSDDSTIQVWVVPTNEELVIAKQTLEVINK